MGSDPLFSARNPAGSVDAEWSIRHPLEWICQEQLCRLPGAVLSIEVMSDTAGLRVATFSLANLYAEAYYHRVH